AALKRLRHAQLHNPVEFVESVLDQQLGAMYLRRSFRQPNLSRRMISFACTREDYFALLGAQDELRQRVLPGAENGGCHAQRQHRLGRDTIEIAAMIESVRAGAAKQSPGFDGTMRGYEKVARDQIFTPCALESEDVPGVIDFDFFARNYY